MKIELSYFLSNYYSLIGFSIQSLSLIYTPWKYLVKKYKYRFAFDTKIFFDIVSKKIFFIIGMTLEARLCTTESVVFCFFGFLLCDWRRSCNNVVHIPLFCIKLVIRQQNECTKKIDKKFVSAALPLALQ